MCASIAAGVTAPSGQCAASPPCGNTGACNGSGGCQHASGAVVCGTATSCAGSTYQPVSHCDGAGACAQAAAQSCSPYVCGESSCLGGCSNDNQCDALSFCSGGACVAKRGTGVSCMSDAQCATGNCINGFCCGSTSCPSCQSCGVRGSEGMCADLPAGSTDPMGMCADEGVASCGTNGRCNGAGNCQRYPVGTPCNQACEGENLTSSTCDAAGMCSVSETHDCTPLMCTTAGCASP
jgi:hypothetical protein